MNRVSIFLIFFLFTVTHTMPTYSLKSVPEGYLLSLTVPQLTTTSQRLTGTTADNILLDREFSRLMIKGFAESYDNPGGPQLLISSFKIAIEDELPELEVLSLETEEIELQHQVYPTQRIPTFSKEDSFTTLYDTTKYESARATDTFVTLSEPFTIRNQGGVSLIIHPLTYNGRANSLRKLTKLELLIKMKHPSRVRSGRSRHYDRYLREVFQNFKTECHRQIPSEQFRNKEVYAIVVADQYANNPDLQRFIEFRQQEYEVVVRTVTECGGVNPAGVNAFLKEVQPTFALFVGWYRDFLYQQGVTPLNSSWILTYLYYQSYGAFDPHPDFHLGLFFVRDEIALRNAVNKTIYTANNLDKMGNGYVAFTGHDMKMGPGVFHIEEFLDELEEEYWNKMDLDLTKIYVARNPDMDADICVNKMNEGVRFINYNGHGWEYGWVYKQEKGNVNWTSKYGLENWGKIENSVYPFVLSCACLTGNFMWEGAGDMSWAETWLGHEGLATAFIGSQQSSSFNQHALNRGMVHRIYNNDLTQYGVMMDYAKEYTYDSLGARFGDIGAQEYHLFGDPAIETMVKEEAIMSDENVKKTHSTLSILSQNRNSITLNIPKSGMYTISLMQLNGRRAIAHKSRYSTGNHTVSFTQNCLAKGIYLLHIKGELSSLTEKILLQ